MSCKFEFGDKVTFQNEITGEILKGVFLYQTYFYKPKTHCVVICKEDEKHFAEISKLKEGW